MYFALLEYRPPLDMVHLTMAILFSLIVHGEEKSPSCTKHKRIPFFTDCVIYVTVKIINKK